MSKESIYEDCRNNFESPCIDNVSLNTSVDMYIMYGCKYV